jgi:hypothetical protein
MFLDAQSRDMNHFSYHSEQVHSVFVNGKGQTRRNIVDIKDGKGIKAVETYTVDGKRKQRNEKQLTSNELECIQKNKFIPGLFKDCIKPLKAIKTRKHKLLKRGKSRKTRVY